MVLILYVATALVCLWLVHRFVRPLSRWAAVVLIVLPLGVVGYALITGGVYGPVDHIYQFPPFGSQAGARNASAVDVWSEFFPWRAAVRESLAKGEWPLWNPYNLTGHPLAGEAQSAPFSPFTLIACLLPPAVSMTYTAAMALFLAALGAFVLARELECSEIAALVGAAGWGMASCVVLYSQTAMGFTTVFAPLLLAAVRRVVWRPGMASGALLMVALTLTVLAGHPESLFLNVLIGGIYAVFELIRRRVNPLRSIATAVVAGVLALLLSAIALLPLLEAIPQSIEYLVKSEAFTKLPRGVAAKVTLASLATDVFPYLHVRRWESPKLGYIGAETAAVGSIVLALAVYAVWRRRSAETWFFAALGLFCVLAGARWAPIAETLHKLPLLSITFHDRLAFHGALCLVVLAALAVDRLEARPAAITFGAVLVVLALGTWWLHRNVVLAETAADYGRYRVLAELLLGSAAVPAAGWAASRRPRAVVLLALIIGQRALSEIDTFPTSRAAFPRVPIFESVTHPGRIVGRGLALPPATNIFYGLEDARGYEALTLAQYVKTWKLWCTRHGIWFNRVDNLTAPFLAMMNVRYAVQSDALPVPNGWRVVATQPGAMLLENPAALERAFIPARVFETGGSTEEIVDRMSGVTDFRSIAFITGKNEGERENGPGAIRATKSGWQADMQNDGYVVISNAAWKGWQAFVDNKRVPIRRANAAFLAVNVPRGAHAVRLVYKPASFVQGRAISFITLALLVLTAAARRSMRRRSG